MTENPFLQWRAAGYQDLIPVVPPNAICSPTSHVGKSKGKSPGIRYPTGLWAGLPGWNTIQATEEDLISWHAMGASIGLRFGEVWLLDLDIYEEARAEEIEAEAIRQFGPAPLRIGLWPKRALLYRSDGTVRMQKVHFAGGDGVVNTIEIPPQGVVQGIHAKTGKPYEWRRPPIAFEELTVVTGHQVDAFMAAMKAKLPNASRTNAASDNEVSQASLRGQVEHVAQTMTTLPNTADMRWDYMIKVGYAVKASLPDEPDIAFDLWDQWCSRWEDDGYDYEIQQRRWESLKGPFRVGAGWLVDQVQERTKPKDAEKGAFLAELMFEVVDGVASMTEEGTPKDSLFDVSTKAEEAPAGKKLLLTPFIAAADQALTSSTKPLVKGLLDQGTLSVMYGPSNVGKTFVAMDVAFHVASGMPWGGLRTSRGAVVYVAAEGGSGAKKRAEALRRRYPEKMEGLDFHLLLSNVDLLRPDADLKPLIQAILDLGVPVVMVVLDTLARVMAGGEENGSTDMGTMIKHFDLIRKHTGAHVMIVHHAGKNQAAGARGHSSLRAATDTEIEIAEGQILVTKQRDLEKSYQSAFRLDVVTLGADEDGDPITSCTVALVPRIEAQASPATPTEQIVLDALCAVVSSDDETGRGAKVVEVVDVLGAQKHGMEAETVRAHLKNLAKKNLARSPARGFWVPKSGNSEYKSNTTFFEPISEEDLANRKNENSGVFD